MTTQNVLTVVSLSRASRDQQIAFMGAMLDRNWRAPHGLRGAWQAAFPASASDDEIVDHSEKDVADCAAASGIEHWDAVCLLSD